MAQVLKLLRKPARQAKLFVSRFLSAKAGLVLLVWLAPLSCPRAQPPPLSNPSRWWKGNLHTHSFWSDGDDYPEMIVGWYKEHGYEFLALSDHNRMQVGEKWIAALTNGVSGVALEKYLRRYGTNWVERREETAL